MPRTRIKTDQVEDGYITRDDLNTTTAGQAVVRKLIPGTGITFSSTGVDAGTGDVTINAAGGSGMNWSTITSANVATAATNNGYLMRTGGTLRTVTLPLNVPAGFYCSVNADGGQVRIVSNGNVIDLVGAGNDLLMPTDSTVTLVGVSSGVVEILYGTTVTATAVGSGGGISRSVNNISAPTTAGAAASTDYVYNVSGTTTLTLPTAVGNTNLYSVTNTGAAVVTIATTSGQTINGSATASIPRSNDSLSFISDGTNWRIV